MLWVSKPQYLSDLIQLLLYPLKLPKIKSQTNYFFYVGPLKEDIFLTTFCSLYERDHFLFMVSTIICLKPDSIHQSPETTTLIVIDALTIQATTAGSQTN